MDERGHLVHRGPGVDGLGDGERVLLEDVDVPHNEVGSHDDVEDVDAVGGLVDDALRIGVVGLQLLSEGSLLLLELVDLPVSVDLDVVEGLGAGDLANKDKTSRCL